MNRELISYKDNRNNYVKSYSICLFIIILFGLVKNIIMASSYTGNILNNVKILLFPVLGAISGIILDYLKYKKISIDITFVEGLLIGVITPVMCPIWVYLIGLVIFSILYIFDNKSYINRIVLVRLIISLILFLCNKYTYFNYFEINNEFKYSLFDLFWGNGVGSAFVTSVLGCLISFVILSINTIYKKSIALTALISYICTLLIFLFLGHYMKVFELILNCNSIFAIIFIAPFTKYSPYQSKLTIIYSIIVGVVGAILSYYINSFEGIYLILLFINFIIILYNLVIKRHNI